MMADLDGRLLREVSRSFALSIQLLPRPMREPVGLAYLLARASDTLADARDVPSGEKLAALDGFIAEMKSGDRAWRADGLRFLAAHPHAGERRLMEGLDACFAALMNLPDGQQKLVVEVIDIITSGQRLDVERFAKGPAVLSDADELEDYCWRVAGCVGAFWTRIGFETLGKGFSEESSELLAEVGITFGKGLQLVNILRDLPGDLEAGRCYLPVGDPENWEALMAEAARWRAVSREWLSRGEFYAGCLKKRRLRAASVLPSLLGTKTLDRLDQADWEALRQGVKVDRPTVRRALLRSLLWRKG